MHIMKRAAVLIIAAATAIYVLQADNSSGSRDDPVPGNLALYELKDKLEREIQSSQMEVVLSLYDFSTGLEIEINGDEPFYPASMIKTLLLLTALKQAEEGELALNEQHTLSDRDRFAGNTPVTGSGKLQYAENGSVYTFEELLSLMVSVSDNIATNIVFERVSPAALEQMADKLGLEQSAFTRKMYEMDSPLPSNVSTARELTAMLKALEVDKATGNKFSELGFRMMEETTDKARIGRYLAEGDLVVANKVGTVTGIIGDMALIYFPHRPPLALSVAVKNPADPEEAARLIGLLARLAVKQFSLSPLDK